MYESELARARELLPLWVSWASPIVFPALTFVLVFAFASAGAAWFARPLRAAPQAHWTERARHLSRIRSWITITMFVVLMSMIFTPNLVLDRFAVVSMPWRILACVAVAIVARSWARTRVTRTWNPALASGPASTWKRTATWHVLFMLPMYVALFVLELLGANPPLWAKLLAPLLSGLAVVHAVGGALWFGQWLGLLRRVGLRELGVEERFPFTRVWLADLHMANALAFPIVGQVAVTQSARAAFSPAELTAVLRHEAAHLKAPIALNGVRLLFVLLVQAIGYSRVLASAVSPLAPGTICLAAVLVWLALWFWQQRDERSADHAAIGGMTSPAYASALEKLHELNLIPAVWGRRRTHPALYDRMLAAGVTPQWPKPAPAPRPPWYAFIALLTLATCVIAVPRALGDRAMRHRRERGEALFALALLDSADTHLGDLANLEEAAGHSSTAITLHHAAAAVSPLAAWQLALAARLLAATDALDDATRDLEEAERRAAKWPDPAQLEPWLADARVALAYGLGERALRLHKALRPDEALAAYREAARILPAAVWPLADAAIMLCHLRRCDEAAAVLQQARDRAARPGAEDSHEYLETARAAVADCR